MKELLLIGILSFMSIIRVAHLIPIDSQSWNFNETDFTNKREFIVNMTRGAWNAYTEFAWGNDTLYPLSKRAENPDNIGETIFAAATTLYIMGLKDEYEKAASWIRNFNVSEANSAVNRNDLLVNNIGSLLSLYALTGDGSFVNKSKEIAVHIKRTYKTETGVPCNYLDFNRTILTNSLIALENIGAQQPEIIFLSDVTSYSELKLLNAKIKQFVKNVHKPKGLFLRHLDVHGGVWVSPLISSLGSHQAILTNLLNAFIQSNGQDKESMDIFNSAVDAAEKNGLIDDFSGNSSKSFYVREYNTETEKHSDEMHSSSCYLGGLLSLAANATKALAKNQILSALELIKINNRAERYSKFAVGITETCNQTANRTKTGILPRSFAANASTNAIDSKGITSPELASSYFVLWRTTQLERYREYAWQLTQAIWTHSSTESGGYADVKDVNQVPATDKIDYQVPSFLSGTLKYLYLTFADDSVLPLGQWIFNLAGHPLPVFGQNAAYPTEKCSQL